MTALFIITILLAAVAAFYMGKDMDMSTSIKLFTPVFVGIAFTFAMFK